MEVRPTWETLDRPECTKYQVLFDPSPCFHRYRLAFFSNTKHNRHRGQQDWLLNALKTLAGNLDEGGKRIAGRASAERPRDRGEAL